MTLKKERPASKRISYFGKSYFWQFVLSYLLILALPLSAILITYFTSANILRNQLLRVGSMTAEKTFSDFDQTLGQMLQTLMQISANGKVNALLNSEARSGDPYALLEIKQYLGGLLNGETSDILLYHRASDSVLSASNSRLESRYFFDAYLDQEKSGYEDWYSRLNARNSRTLDWFYGKGTQPTLALFQSFPLNSVREHSMTAAIVLNYKAFKELLEPKQMQPESAVLIFDREGAPFLSTDPQYASIPLPKELSGEEWNIGHSGGQEYVIQCFRSKALPYTYGYLVPTAVFWNQLTSLKFLVTAATVLCMLVSLGLTLLLARRNYRPFKRVLGFIGGKTQRLYNRSKENEADFITNAFEEVLTQRENLNLRMERERTGLKEKFLYELMQGMVGNRETLVRGLSQYGIPVLGGGFQVALFDSEAPSQKLNELRQEYAGKFCEDFCTLLSTQTTASGFACVFCMEEGASLSVPANWCRELLKIASNGYGLPLSCGIGSRKKQPEEIHGSYVEALQALEYQGVYGRGLCIKEEEIRGRRFFYRYQGAAQAEEMLLEFVKKQAETGGAQRCFEEITRRFLGEEPPTHEMIRCFRHDLTRLMDRVLSEAQAGRLEKDRGILDRLFKADSFLKFKEIFIEEMEALREFCHCGQSQNEMVTKALSTIKEHFTDVDLNVNTLGNAVGLSPSYLSKLFREDTGTGIGEYLLELRVSKAKQLLLESGRTMEEIARLSGFLDSSSFVRTFKKSEGITPGSFRKLHNQS